MRRERSCRDTRHSRCSSRSCGETRVGLSLPARQIPGLRACSRVSRLTRVLLRSAFSSEISSSLSRSCSRQALSSRVSVANSCRDQGSEQGHRWDGASIPAPLLDLQHSISHPNPTKVMLWRTWWRGEPGQEGIFSWLPSCFGQGEHSSSRFIPLGLMSNDTRNCSTAAEVVDGI